MNSILALAAAGVLALGSPQDKKEPPDHIQPLPMPKNGMADFWKQFVYPEEAKKKGIQGTVYVTATVDETGKVVAVKVARGGHPILDSAAIAAVRATPFSPGRHEGKPVKAEVTIPIKFQLADSVKVQRKAPHQ